MVSNTKLYARLDSLEQELLEVIVPHLKRAASGHNEYIFCVKQFNPYRKLKNKTDKVTEELIAIGVSIISLREKLGEPTQGTTAERICWYCREWSGTDNLHKALGTDLAKRFLSEIEDESNKRS